MNLEIDRAGDIEWQRVRQVRLAALEESPDAFGSTLAEERQYDEDRWRQWCRDGALFVASQQGIPVGMAAGVPGSAPEEVKLIAMWVHPAHRGTGTGAALLTAVRNWAESGRATTMTLWVTRNNEAASRLYRRSGFAPTGVVKPLPSNPGLVEDQWALTLD